MCIGQTNHQVRTNHPTTENYLKGLVVQLAVGLVGLRRQKTKIKTNSDDEAVVQMF